MGATSDTSAYWAVERATTREAYKKLEWTDIEGQWARCLRVMADGPREAARVMFVQLFNQAASPAERAAFIDRHIEDVDPDGTDSVFESWLTAVAADDPDVAAVVRAWRPGQ